MTPALLDVLPSRTSGTTMTSPPAVVGRVSASDGQTELPQETPGRDLAKGRSSETEFPNIGRYPIASYWYDASKGSVARTAIPSRRWPDLSPENDETEPAPKFVEYLTNRLAIAHTPSASLSFAAEALKELILETAAHSNWLGAAQQLKTAAVEMSQQAPRHAAIALLLSDALVFTPAQIMVTPPARQALLQGLLLLRESFIAADEERHAVRALLAAGWSLTGPFDAEEFAELVPESPS